MAVFHWRLKIESHTSSCSLSKETTALVTCITNFNSTFNHQVWQKLLATFKNTNQMFRNVNETDDDRVLGYRLGTLWPFSGREIFIKCLTTTKCWRIKTSSYLLETKVETIVRFHSVIQCTRYRSKYFVNSNTEWWMHIKNSNHMSTNAILLNAWPCCLSNL